MKNFSIEALKILSAAISLLIYILLGKITNSYFLVIYTFSLTILVIFTSIFDRGLNIVNLNKDISGYQFITVSIKHSVIVSIFMCIAIISYTFYNNFDSTFNYILLILSVIISTPFATYIMRWNTVFRREGNLKKQILLGEIMPLIFRGTLTISLSLFFGYYGFIIALILPTVITSLYLKKNYPITNLNILSYKDCIFSNHKASLHTFILSVLISIKNQILGLLIPLVRVDSQATLVVISRVYGIVVILISGIFSRIPYSLKDIHLSSGKRRITVYTIIVLFFSFSFIFLSFYWLPISSYIFSIDSILNYYIFILIVIIGLGLLTSFISLVLQVLSRIKTSFFIEITYITILILFSLYGGYLIG